MRDDRTTAGVIRFAKMEGSGNDFVLVNGTKQALPRDLGETARSLCRRRTSIGADGLILVESSEREEAAVRFRFWNPDGGEIATCGNGTRCAARFATVEGLAPPEMSIETAGGNIHARVSGTKVSLRFEVVPSYKPDFDIASDDGIRRGHYFDIGNQHFILPVDELPAGPIEPLCRPLRFAPELGPLGANISLAEVVDRHRIRIRTYERGVEAETLACGSGSLSSAASLSAAGLVDPPVEVETRSSEVLTVHFERTTDGGFTNLELEGPARFVFWGEYRDERDV